MRVFKYFREGKRGLSHTIPLSPPYPIYPNLIPKGQMVLGFSLFYEFTLAPRSGSRPYNSAMGSLRKGVDYVKSRIGKDSPSERSEGGKRELLYESMGFLGLQVKDLLKRKEVKC